ncbi:hypothetical protein L2E82_33691 [Cichorium intybus]|uniref:Uncharacterized protein n=1 Tax=Cichorium intybus TaxID=13427 RepID=A0ACB9BL86_CICIN|nr:hypothetical protein L2E82_33691 [Cichorium intybus]
MAVGHAATAGDSGGRRWSVELASIQLHRETGRATSDQGCHGWAETAPGAVGCLVAELQQAGYWWPLFLELARTTPESP